MSFFKDWKNSLLILASFFVGIFSVSISNLFWGYYGIGFAICLILYTLFMFNLLNNKLFDENKVDFGLMSVGLFFQFLFFVVNDIFSASVYQKNNVNFWGWVVIVSQIYSCGVVIYLMIKSTYSLFRKKNVEIVEKHGLENKEENCDEEEFENLDIDNENVETIKSIPILNIKTKTFNEEEIK